VRLVSGTATVAVSAYSREVLAATFNTHIDELPDFPLTASDPLIVNRRNPVDEHAMGE
jgi:oxalate decarboxylase